MPKLLGKTEQQYQLKFISKSIPIENFWNIDYIFLFGVVFFFHIPKIKLFSLDNWPNFYAEFPYFAAKEQRL